MEEGLILHNKAVEDSEGSLEIEPATPEVPPTELSCGTNNEFMASEYELGTSEESGWTQTSDGKKTGQAPDDEYDRVELTARSYKYNMSQDDKNGSEPRFRDLLDNDANVLKDDFELEQAADENDRVELTAMSYNMSQDDKTDSEPRFRDLLDNDANVVKDDFELEQAAYEYDRVEHTAMSYNMSQDDKNGSEPRFRDLLDNDANVLEDDFELEQPADDECDRVKLTERSYNMSQDDETGSEPRYRDLLDNDANVLLLEDDFELDQAAVGTEEADPVPQFLDIGNATLSCDQVESMGNATQTLSCDQVESSPGVGSEMSALAELDAACSGLDGSVSESDDLDFDPSIPVHL